MSAFGTTLHPLSADVLYEWSLKSKTNTSVLVTFLDCSFYISKVKVINECFLSMSVVKKWLCTNFSPCAPSISPHTVSGRARRLLSTCLIFSQTSSMELLKYRKYFNVLILVLGQKTRLSIQFDFWGSLDSCKKADLSIWIVPLLEEPCIIGGRWAPGHEHVVLLVQPDKAEVARPYGERGEWQTLYPLLLEIRVPSLTWIWVPIQLYLPLEYPLVH